MSDEEKKAIKNVEKFVYSILNGISAYDCKVVLNLIEKQSKEIEEYKKQLDLDYVRNNYINNDKIKAKIEELKKVRTIIPKDNNYTYRELIDYGIEELQSLLEKE